VWLMKEGWQPALPPRAFVIGIYEAQLERMDAKLARLIDEYLDAGGALGIMSAGPALHRVVPSHAAIQAGVGPALR